ncbi:MAG: hypothetical protein HZB09_02670 [Candidatus Yonathbacteria bacterium]|nr:hypothetical protein [Candidatus Yonathbacteria bacterium]
MDILGKLFGNPARVKIMRLFLLNPLTPFDIVEISEKSKTKREIARKEAALLELVGLVKKRAFSKEISAKKPSEKTKKQRVTGWVLDESFPLLFPLKNVLMSGNPLNRREELINRFKSCGRLKLLVVSGIFVQESDSRVDILIVGDGLEKRAIESALRGLEAEMGKELTYAFLETPEFTYRMGIYDKFIRDIFDYPHEKVMDKLGLS